MTKVTDVFMWVVLSLPTKLLMLGLVLFLGLALAINEGIEKEKQFADFNAQEWVAENGLDTCSNRVLSGRTLRIECNIVVQ